MTRKNAGVLSLLLAVGVILLSASVAGAFNLRWNAVTTYTDGSAIEPAKTVLYNVKMDGASVATALTVAEWPIPSPSLGHGIAHTFEVQTELSTGEVSAWSAPFPWTSPAGVPQSPSGLTVQ